MAYDDMAVNNESRWHRAIVHAG